MKVDLDALACPAGLPDCPKRTLVREMVIEYMRRHDSLTICAEKIDVMQRMANEILSIVQPEDENAKPDRMAQAGL